MSLTDDEIKTIKDAAVLLGANHSATAVVMLEAVMLEVASNKPSTGGYGGQKWVASLRAMGEVATTLAKYEGEKMRRIGL